MYLFAPWFEELKQKKVYTHGKIALSVSANYLKVAKVFFFKDETFESILVNFTSGFDIVKRYDATFLQDYPEFGQRLNIAQFAIH